MFRGTRSIKRTRTSRRVVLPSSQADDVASVESRKRAQRLSLQRHGRRLLWQRENHWWWWLPINNNVRSRREYNGLNMFCLDWRKGIYCSHDAIKQTDENLRTISMGIVRTLAFTWKVHWQRLYSILRTYYSTSWSTKLYCRMRARFLRWRKKDRVIG